MIIMNKKNKKPTITDVAEKAGVSRGTVDRVVNSRSHVSPGVYERVMKAISETGYLSPRQAHQNNLTQINSPSIILGVLMPNWTGHFKWEILRGIAAAEEELKSVNVKVIIKECETDIPEENLTKLEELLKEGAVALSICTINDPVIIEKIKELKEKHIPVITYNSDIPGSERLCFIGQNYNKSGRIAAQIISKCISKDDDILAAVGNLEFFGHHSRLKGFLERMNELGFSEDKIKVIETYNSYQLTYKKVLTELNLNNNIHAIYMANRSVVGCTKAVADARLDNHMRIVCHDFSEHTKKLLQEETIDFSIGQDLFKQGYLPLIMLHEYIFKGTLPENLDTNTMISIYCSQNL